MNNEITIHLNVPQIAILRELSPRDRGVVLSTLFSLSCGSECEDGLRKGTKWNAEPFVEVEEDEDRYYPLMKIAAGIKEAAKSE